MPIDRSDILAFLQKQDRIADTVEDIAKIMEIRKTRLPLKLKKGTLESTNKVVETVEALNSAVKELEKILQSSFGKRERERMLKLISNIERKEWEADCLEIELMKKLLK